MLRALRKELFFDPLLANDINHSELALFDPTDLTPEKERRAAEAINSVKKELKDSEKNQKELVAKATAKMIGISTDIEERERMLEESLLSDLKLYEKYFLKITLL